MKTPIVLLILMSVWEPFLTGQGIPGRQDELIGWHILAGKLSMTGRRLGNRMQAAGKERVAIGGMLRDARGERLIQLTFQPPGLFRLDDPTSQRVVGFDGTVVSKRNGNGQASETEDLLETLVLSSPEMLFDALARQRGAVRLIGTRFRVDWGTGPAPNTSIADVYEVYLPGTSKGNATGREQRLMLCVDSATLLPVSIRRAATPEAIQASEARFLGWVDVGGQQFPTEVVRIQDGREVFRFKLSQSVVSSRQPDTAFRP